MPPTPKPELPLYVVVRAKTVEELETLTSEYLAKGYQPIGGMGCTNWQGVSYYQSIWLPKENR